MRRNILCDHSGATIVEFAIVAPVLVMFIMGAGDLLLQSYASSMLTGEVEKAGRDSTLQANASATATAEIDARVMAAVRQIAPGATYTSSRENYTNFTNVQKPEPFTDSNSDGIRQVPECYSDVNNNNRYDIDQGEVGEGGASDVALYTITVTYRHFFPIVGLFGGNNNAVISAKTLLMNQPYAAQSISIPALLCT